MMRPIRPTSKRADGYKSGLEASLAKQIEQATGVQAEYETRTLHYEKPARTHRYRPDFFLPNGIIIEGKGIFDAADREKHLLVKEQFPELDIRFVFSRANAPLYKGSKTTNASWCEKYGFTYAEKNIPPKWFN